MRQYVWLVMGWVGWCSLHTGLISLPVTTYLQQRFDEKYRYYRIVYNMIAVVTLIPVLLYTVSIQGRVVFGWEGPYRIAQALLAISAVVLFLTGARRYDILRFLGIRQLRDKNACNALTDDCSLDTSGVLGMLRHPWYSGGILIVWARPLDVSAILTNVLITSYFIGGGFLEERKLKVQFGRQYRDYQRCVSMFVPFKWAVCKLRKRFFAVRQG